MRCFAAYYYTLAWRNRSWPHAHQRPMRNGSPATATRPARFVPETLPVNNTHDRFSLQVGRRIQDGECGRVGGGDSECKTGPRIARPVQFPPPGSRGDISDLGAGERRVHLEPQASSRDGHLLHPLNYFPRYRPFARPRRGGERLSAGQHYP